MTMRAIELIAEVDAHHGLQIALPSSVPPGKVRVIVLTPDTEEDDAWKAELLDSCEDIYTLEDGEPSHGVNSPSCCLASSGE